MTPSSQEALTELAVTLGIRTCIPFPASELVPMARIRALCAEDKCGNYGNHYTCPPHIGTLDEARARLSRFERGYLLQYGRALDVRNDRMGLRQSRLDFHEMVLRLEQTLHAWGHREALGLIGGECALCEPCLARTSAPCPFPERARPSLESLAIDVLSLLAQHGLDNSFAADRITWTGCVLIGPGQREV